MDYKNIVSINGPLVLAKGTADFAMHDLVFVGEKKVLGEVIRIEKDIASIQVYENTTGLKIGEQVEGTGRPLNLTLAPGLIGNIFDGIQRPLKSLREQTGDFIIKGTNISAVDIYKKWHFIPKINQDDKVSLGTIVGEVKETSTIINKIMNDNDIEGVVTYIAPEGDYTVRDIVAKVKDPEENEYDVCMAQKWPVRKQRKYRQRLSVKEPLLTGQRIVDTMFPVTKGGTAMLPGGFGTGKTMLQHQVAKYCDADIIVYIGCGERGNEMTEVLEDFPKLIDPKTGKSLMERTVLIANTSNMPVAAREASIYTGITIAEYYRDMGYNVAIMADSTSRWAESLKEISGRLEEMPAEEGFPSYLPSRISEFYGRAGYVQNFNGTEGSITIIGAVSPQGADFSEPVTQNTKRFVHVFWGLDRSLAYSRHYPAVNWITSYSEYLVRLKDWYEENIDINFYDIRQRMMKLLEEENELLEIAKVVGQDVLSDNKKLILEICRIIRIGFLQQSALNEIDTAVPLEKQFKMMETLMIIYDNSLKLIEKGIPISKIKELGFFEEYVKLKYNIRNDELDKFKTINTHIKEELKKLEEEYKAHI